MIQTPKYLVLVRSFSVVFSLKGSVMDKVQEKLLEEKCILVNENDEVIGEASKRECHLNSNIKKGMLHRAFSVFLFNNKNELLLQQRSDAKITFPGRFTNTCCSHPLHFAKELDEKDFIGVRRAAQRKLEHELGIKASEVPLEDFELITRIHYKAMSDEKWGEHEIDHVLFIKKDVNIKTNPNEVKSFNFVDQEKMRQMLEDAKTGKIAITPWFDLLCKKFLFNWWENMNNIENIKDPNTIHTMIDN